MILLILFIKNFGNLIFYVFLGQISTFFYFLSIWFLIPFIGRIETLLLSKKETELKN